MTARCGGRGDSRNVKRAQQPVAPSPFPDLHLSMRLKLLVRRVTTAAGPSLFVESPRVRQSGFGGGGGGGQGFESPSALPRQQGRSDRILRPRTARPALIRVCGN
jgi:hypothetical protein